MIYLKNSLIIFFWFILSYFIFLFQPARDFESYIDSLKPKYILSNENLTLVEKSDSYQIFSLKYNHNQQSLEAFIKIPINGENLPAVIILGGMLTGKEAVNYAYSVENVIIAAPDYRYKPRSNYDIFSIICDLPKAYNALYMQIIDNLLLLDFLENRTNSANRNISIVGYSFGVPFAIATASVDKRVGHLALVYGGADLDFLIRHNLKLINPLIDELLGFIFWLHVMNFEPETLCKRIDAREIMLINGLHDEKIPETAAKKLQESIPYKKTIIWVESKHVHPKNKNLSLKIINHLNEWYNKSGFFIQPKNHLDF